MREVSFVYCVDSASGLEALLNQAKPVAEALGCKRVVVTPAGIAPALVVAEDCASMCSAIDEHRLATRIRMKYLLGEEKA